MEPGDVDAAHALSRLSFDDLDRRLGHEPHSLTSMQVSIFRGRLASFVEHDRPGCWVAEQDDELVGVTTASMREGVWGLSLLAVRPGAQATGIGKTLLDLALEYGQGSHTGIICASDDSRALRRYAAAGFRLYPGYEAGGVPTAPGEIDTRYVEQIDPSPFVVSPIDRAVRGGARGPDYALLTRPDLRWYGVKRDGARGYAIASDDRVLCVAAETEEAAAALLRRILAEAAHDGRATALQSLTGGQQWALDVVLEFRLSLELTGSVCWRGRPEPRAYLPNGALL